MDRFWTVLIWIIVFAALLGILRYWQGANALLQTILGFFGGESTLLAGYGPQGGTISNYPAYNNRGA